MTVCARVFRRRGALASRSEAWVSANCGASVRALSGRSGEAMAIVEQAATTLLLTDQALAGQGQGFEQRLESARRAIGRTPSSEQEWIQREAARPGLSIDPGSPTQPDVAGRARAVRLRKDIEPDEPFERRLAGPKRHSVARR